MRDVMGGNLMRVMDEVDALKERLKDELPSSAVWEKRTDLPATGWGIVGNVSFFPVEVKKAIDNLYLRHDEL
jgi:membrane dipeptidase